MLTEEHYAEIVSDENIGKYICLIKNSVLRKFVDSSLKRYSTIGNIKEANKVAEYVVAKIHKQGINISDNTGSTVKHWEHC